MMGVGLGLKQISILNMGWVKSMPGDFGKVTTIIGLVINFLEFGTPFVTLCDTLTYIYIHICVLDIISCGVAGFQKVQIVKEMS